MQRGSSKGWRKLWLALVIALGTTASSLTAQPVNADGEVVGPGPDIAGNVYIWNGHARVNFSNIGNCPGLVPNTQCWVDIRFRWLCAEPWCLWWDTSPWYKVPTGQDYYVHPGCADGYNKWVVETRIHYLYPTVQNMNFRGDYELTVGGNNLIGRYLFSATLNAGYTLGLNLGWIAAAEAVGGQGVIAESNGYIAGPPTC